MTATEEGTTRRGRPRDASLGRRVREVARRELIRRGSPDFTLAEVARQAGVAKGSVYLRWSNVYELLVDALVEESSYLAVTDTGSLRNDLLQLADRLVRSGMSAPRLELNLRFIAAACQEPERYARYQQREIVAGIRRAEAVFERAVERGEVPPDIDVRRLTEAFTGALLMETFISPNLATPDAAAQEAIVDVFVRLAGDTGNMTARNGKATRARVSR